MLKDALLIFLLDIYWNSWKFFVYPLEFWFTPFTWLSINQFTPDISLMFNQLQCVIHSWCAGPKCMVVDFNFKNVCFFFSPKLLVQKMGGGIIWSLPVPRVCSNGVIKWPWVVTTQAHLFGQKPTKHICTKTRDRASISIFIGVGFSYLQEYLFRLYFSPNHILQIGHSDFWHWLQKLALSDHFRKPQHVFHQTSTSSLSIGCQGKLWRSYVWSNFNLSRRKPWKGFAHQGHDCKGWRVGRLSLSILAWKGCRLIGCQGLAFEGGAGIVGGGFSSELSSPRRTTAPQSEETSPPGRMQLDSNWRGGSEIPERDWKGTRFCRKRNLIKESSSAIGGSFLTLLDTLSDGRSN